ncbi:hypothetical protein CAEBREN_09463 [Caenorhabditis brenneri]|uniref:Uncharacterized protein n=1 Tax=Caenorhabditis brenneri TaxID=135651 RepID=G0PEF2_CAEBE|nr:hypothetical protein CAEBREN_09463 [Caenorhabditis brenneri]
MASTIYRLITIVSLLSLIHCAYSAAQHRFYLRLTEQPFVSLPADVVAQTVISLIALIYGTSFLANPFQYIKKDQHHDRTCDEALNCPSFITFDNRAKAMSPDIPKSKPKSTRVLEISKAQADEAFRSCLEMVRKHDVDSYLAILTMNKKAQPEIVALNALNVELASIRDKVDTRRGDTSAMYRLQFWKDAISSIYEMSPLPVPRQPVAIALCSFASRANPNMLLKLVETRQSTIGDRQFTDITALCEYGRSTIGSLLCLQIDALARMSSETTVLSMAYDVAKDLGAAYAIANMIRATHPLLARGIVLLPADVMSLNGATPDSLYKKKKLEEACGMTKDLVNESKRLLIEARSNMAMVPKAVRPALAATGTTTDYIIKTIEKNKYDIYSSHLQRRNPFFIWSLLVKNLCSKF